MQILDGKTVSSARLQALKPRVEEFRRQNGREPGLGVILVGQDPASQVYVRRKLEACKASGFASFEVVLPDHAPADLLREKIKGLNDNPLVDGYLIQMPVPGHLQAEPLMDLIDPLKDADGLTPTNLGLLWAGRPRVVPCTPSGVMAILDHYQIPVAGRRAVVVGRSQIVGRPMAELLLSRDATVTIAHSKTPDLAQLTKEADIVVVAAGRPQLLGRDAFKKGSVVIDVGIHRFDPPQGASKAKLVGDVRFEELDGWAAAATPVPGGVGPMTITMLLENTLRLAQLREQ